MKRTMPVAFLLAMAIGLAGGLLYTWILDPVEYYDSAPNVLGSQGRLVYLALVGDLYASEGDLAWATERLTQLGVEADGSVLAGLIEQHLDRGGQPEEVRNLARLAEALGASGGVLLVFASASTPTPTMETVISTLPAASPTPAPSPTPLPSFELIEQTATCAEPGRPGQIAVWVRDVAGDDLAGVEIVVSWSAGQDRFFTGLRPEKGVGYADFQMASQVEYEVALAAFGGDSAEGLTADLSPGVCPTGTVALDWGLTFQQRE